jgi:hypothetical protein
MGMDPDEIEEIIKVLLKVVEIIRNNRVLFNNRALGRLAIVLYAWSRTAGSN